MPEMENGLPFELPMGVFDGEGNNRTTVRVKPWKAGRLKRKLGRLNPKKGADLAKSINLILEECLVSVTGFGRISERLLESMPGPDRQFCACKARELSRGPKIVCEVPCPYCGEPNEETKELDKLKVGRLTDEVDVLGPNGKPTGQKTLRFAHEVEDELDARGETTGRKIRTFTATNIPGGYLGENKEPFDAVFRFANGADAKAVAQESAKPNRSDVDSDFLVYSRTCLRWGDYSPPFPIEFWEGLTDPQLERLEDVFEDYGYLGPETSSIIPCAGCGRKLPITVYGTDFLLRLPRSLTNRS